MNETILNETANAVGAAITSGKGIFASIFDAIVNVVVSGINWITSLVTGTIDGISPDLVFIAISLGVALLLSKRTADSKIFRISLTASLFYLIMRTAAMLKGVAS